MAEQLKGITLRLYPNKTQEATLIQMCGNDRFVWNQLNSMIQSRYENNKHLYDSDNSKEAKERRRHVMLSHYDMNNLLPQLKNEYPFLRLSESSALQMTSEKLSKAYSNFFKNPKHFSPPKFKKRDENRLRYSGRARTYVSGRRYLKLPKLGHVKTSKTSCLKDTEIRFYTIERDSTNRWYVTLQVKASVTDFEKTNKIVGLDLGLTDMVVSSDGFKSGRFLETELENEIKSKQRIHSRRRHRAKVEITKDKQDDNISARTILDFSNVEKARVTKAKLQKHLENKRKDFLHKLSTRLVKAYDVIVIEDLSSKKMMQDHRLARSIGNASWYKFRLMLEYKCRWYGKQLIIVQPNYTSQECSNCHHDSGKKTLDIREWTCSNCGVYHDRDINAAKNILAKGLETMQVA